MTWLDGYRMRLVLVGFVGAIVLGGGIAHAAAINKAPIAEAGSSRYAAQNPVVLDGANSYDPDISGPLSYRWRQIAGPTATISDANAAKPSISGFTQTDAIQECEFELLVTDGALASLADTVKVIIVPDFHINKLIHLNPPFDPQKPTWITFGGLGGCRNVGSDPSWFLDYPEGWGGWGVLDEKVNYITFKQFNHSLLTIKQIGDMLIVYLSNHAPDYKQPIQSDGTSAGGEPAIDIGIHLNETYADRRYAVNRVTLLDAAGYCRDYEASIERFLASAVDSEQCWIDSYPGTLPGSYGMKRDYGFQSNVLNVWFDAATGPGGVQYKHALPGNFYGNSLIDPDLLEFNHGVIAGSFWSVLGPGKNLQLASTPGAEIHKFTWYGDASSGFMDFYDESRHPGKLPEPVTLVGPVDAGDPNGAILTSDESENAVGYQLLLGSDPYRVMDYAIISDTPTPPDKIVTTLPFEKTWWTVRVYDEYGSTIYADPKPIGMLNLSSFPIENISTGKRYGYIQDAINDAENGDEIMVSEGNYHENINFKDTTLTIRSTNPSEPAVVAATVISGSSQGPTVTFSNGKHASCLLDGLTITGRAVDISCRDACPTIRNCTIGSIDTLAIEFWHGYEPITIDCAILGLVKEQDDPRLVADWRLDEAEGSMAYDSAAENHATVIGNAIWQPEGGQIDGALQFDGTDDYIQTPRILNPKDGPFSVFAWIKGGNSGQVIVSQKDGVNWLMADSTSGTLRTNLRIPASRKPAGPSLISSTVITDGDWHRIGFVWNGTERILYVDDIEVARDTADNLESAETGLYIGCGADLDSVSFFSGLIDDVRVYNRAVEP